MAMSLPSIKRILVTFFGFFGSLYACAFAFPVDIDPQHYPHRYQIRNVTGALFGPQTIDLDPGNYVFNFGDSSNIGFTVDASGNVTTSNSGALVTGFQSITFKNVDITIDPGDFELNNSDRWGFRFIKEFSSGAGTLGPQTVTVIPNVNYTILVGFQRAFSVAVDANGNVTVPNGVSAVGGARSFTLNTRLVTIDPGSYSLNTNGAFAIRFVHSFSPAPTGGAQQVYLVPGTAPYRLVLGPIGGFAGFFITVDENGLTEAVNGVSATSGTDYLLVNTIPISVDLRDYAMNNIAAAAIRFVHSFQAGVVGPQTVHLAPGGDNYQFVVGALTGPQIFTFQISETGNVVTTNGVSAIGGNGTLDLNTVDITIDPNGYTGRWDLRFNHFDFGKTTIKLVPGVGGYQLLPFGAGAPLQVFSIDANGDPSPSTIPFVINNEQFDFLLFAGSSAPIANAGLDQVVNEGALTTLDGSASLDPQGDTLSYTWTQIAGPTISLINGASASPEFQAPAVGANTTITMQLVVSDGSTDSAPDTVDIVVKNANNPPIADAGDNASVKAGGSFQLNGTNSFDPDSDAITFSWTQASGPVVVLPDATAVQPTFNAPNTSGVDLVFKLVVSDGFEGSTPSAGADASFDDTVAISVVDNSAPIANAGADQAKAEGTLVQLDGSLSSDPDGDGIEFSWTQISGPSVILVDATTQSPSFSAPLLSGLDDSVTFRLTVTDEDGLNPLSATDEVTINLVNVNDPPSCDLAETSLVRLWPPNHKFVDVAINGVEDPDSGVSGVTLTISGITQDEPINGTGDGDTSPDALIVSDDFEFDRVQLRSERSGNDDGRVYEVSFTATDGIESCDGSVSIGVPHNRKSTPVDSGQSYSSIE